MIYQLNEDELAKAQAKMQEDNDRDLAAYAKMHKQQGYDEGREEGIQIGIDKGIEIGIDKGIEIGIDKGVEIGIDKGVEIGIDKGVEIGVLKSKRETAKNLKELGVDIETIMKSTGLSKEEIDKL